VHVRFEPAAVAPARRDQAVEHRPEQFAREDTLSDGSFDSAGLAPRPKLRPRACFESGEGASLVSDDNFASSEEEPELDLGLEVGSESEEEERAVAVWELR
jgi:hypothetical protein